MNSHCSRRDQPRLSYVHQPDTTCCSRVKKAEEISSRRNPTRPSPHPLLLVSLPLRGLSKSLLLLTAVCICQLPCTQGPLKARRPPERRVLGARWRGVPLTICGSALAPRGAKPAEIDRQGKSTAPGKVRSSRCALGRVKLAHSSRARTHSLSSPAFTLPLQKSVQHGPSTSARPKHIRTSLIRNSRGQKEDSSETCPRLAAHPRGGSLPQAQTPSAGSCATAPARRRDISQLTFFYLRISVAENFVVALAFFERKTRITRANKFFFPFKHWNLKFYPVPPMTIENENWLRFDTCCI